jgi:HPr kinase/phosphorylase
MNDQAPLHGSAFAYMGTGCLVIGASGTGKSRITAEAMMMGAKLIADDRVALQPMMGMVAIAQLPELAGILELRGMGLIRMNDTTSKHVLHLVIELDPTAGDRLPELQKRQFLGIDVPYLRLAPAPQTSAALILHYLKAMQEGRVLPTDWKPKSV